MQYLAYRELKAAVQSNRAQSGAVVVLDIATGEVLAMVNQPSFNPNDREQYAASRYRNRAATDIFEPGSSIKPFVVAAAMETGRYDADTLIETSPGTLRVGSKTIQDKHNLGTIDVTTVLAKSSNVGVVKIALTLKPEEMWTGFDRLRLRPRDGQRLSRASRPVSCRDSSTGARSGRRRCPTATGCRSRRCSSRRPTPCSAPAGCAGPSACARSTRRRPANACSTNQSRASWFG